MAYAADDIRKMLAENAALSRRCGEQGDTIRKSAGEELERVNARLAGMLPGQVARDPALAYEYQRLVEERGRLALLALS